jgi:hypothetical protein
VAGRHARGGNDRVTPGDQVAVPPQHCLWSDQQPQPAQHVAGQPVQHRREQGPLRRIESHLGVTQLTLEHCDLVAQGKDRRVLVSIAHRQQTQHGECIRHTQVRQS